MNLFILHEDPTEAARALSDQHVRKMILETAQIIDGGTRPIMADLFPNEPIRGIVKIPPSHRDNPCIHSVRARVVADYAWGHFLGLLAEHTYRTGNRHSYDSVAIRGALHHRLERAAPALTEDGFGLFMPDSYKTASARRVPLAHAIVSYRAYYAAEKHDFRDGPAVWTRRAPPLWMVQYLSQKGYERAITQDGQKQFFKERVPA